MTDPVNLLVSSFALNKVPVRLEHLPAHGLQSANRTGIDSAALSDWTFRRLSSITNSQSQVDKGI